MAAASLLRGCTFMILQSSWPAVDAHSGRLSSSTSVGGLRLDGLEDNSGNAEDCFAAYVQYAASGDMPQLDAGCSVWRTWVSTDGETPDKIHGFRTVVALGHATGNATTGRVGSIPDVGVDLGAGFFLAEAPAGASTGVHLLSIPKNYYSDCCGDGTHSIATALRNGHGVDVCAVLRDSIQAGVKEAAEYSNLKQLSDERSSSGFSQCYHRTPDVQHLHLHTTAGVKAMRDAAGDVDNVWLGPRRYNACVCEPASWKSTSGAGRGNCPASQPNDPAYVSEAATSLCMNIAAVSGIGNRAAEVCSACRPTAASATQLRGAE